MKSLARIRKALDQVASQLGLDEDLLKRAQRRYAANHKRAYKAYEQRIRAQKLTDKFNAFGPNENQAKATYWTKVAARKHVVETKNRARAQVWLGRIKELTQRVNELEGHKLDLEKELKKLSHVTIKGDKATGGTKRERLKAVALASAAACATGRRNNFYSQSGSFDADHCITGPAYGHRDDCSSWFASVYKSAGLADPSGERFTAGYTGTLEANGKQVHSPQPGDAVLYGPPGATHHVEMYVGPGTKTVGHGSAPVDPGVIDLFGDGQYRFFSYV